MIQILITGGTFDKSYDHISGDLFFEKTHIPEMLERSKCRLNVNVKTLMMIDSLEMTQKDIEKILEECKKTNSTKITYSQIYTLERLNSHKISLYCEKGRPTYTINRNYSFARTNEPF